MGKPVQANVSIMEGDNKKKIGTDDVENQAIVQEIVMKTMENLRGTINNDKISSFELKQHLKAYFDHSLKQFFSCRDSANPRLWDKFKGVLIADLKIAFRDFCMDYTNKYSANLTEAVQIFRTQVEAQVGSKCVPLENLQIVLSDVKTCTLQEFASSVADLDELNKRLGQEEQFFIQENNKRLREIYRNLDHKFNSILPDLLETYEYVVEDVLPDDDLETASDQKLESVFQRISRRVLAKLKEHMTFDVREMKEMYENRMIEKVRERFSEKIKAYKSQKEHKILEAGLIVSNAVDNFAKSMSEVFEDASDAAINQFRNEKSKDLMMTLTEEIYEILLDPKAAKQMLESAKEKMENIFQEMKNQRDSQIEKFEKRWDAELHSICDEFQLKMNELPQYNILPEMEELQVSRDIVISDLISKSNVAWLDDRKNKDLIKTFREAAKERMKQLSISIFQDYEKILDNNFEQQKLVMNGCLQSHEFKMKELLKGELDELSADRAENIAFSTLKQFEEHVRTMPPIPPSKTSQFTSDLKQAIRKIQNQFEKQVNDRRLMVKAEVSQLVADVGNDYTHLMNAFVIASNYEKDKIAHIHDNLRNRAQHVLQKNLKLAKYSGDTKEEQRKLQTSIETFYNDIKGEIDNERADWNKKLESCNQKASVHYQQLFNSSMGLVSNEQELKNLHENVKEQVIGIWEESFPIAYLSDILLPERRKFAKKLDNDFETSIFKKWQDINLDIDRNTRAAIEGLVKIYEQEMNNTLSRFDFVSTASILSNDEKFSKQAKIGLNKVDKPKNISKQTYDDLLSSRLLNTLDCFNNQNSQKMENVKIKLSNEIHHLKDGIRGELFTLKMLPETSVLFNNYREWVNTLVNQCKTPADCRNDLVSFAEEKLKETLKTLEVEWDKVQPDSNELQLAINEAVEQYNKEMDNRTSKTGQTFVSSAMKTHHIHSLRVVQKMFQERVRQTSATREQFNEAIEAVLRKYEEHNDLRAAEHSEAAVGIDLGTTFSCVAIYKGNKIEMIPDREEHSNTVPSYVFYETKTKTVVGQSAKDQSIIHPDTTIFDSKRLIGRKFTDDQTQKDITQWPFKVVQDPDRNRKEPKIEVHGSLLHPEEVSGEILKHLKKNAELYLGREVKDVVITVPAYFNDAQKRATKNAAAFANINVLEIINEPTSAAIAYSLHHTDGKSRNILVFDLGGGTFDVSVLSTKKRNIEVKAVGGDNHLGGEDFDSNMVDFCIEKFRQETGLVIPKNVSHTSAADEVNHDSSKTFGALRRLRQKCEHAKKNLSKADKVRVLIDNIFDQKDLDVWVTVKDFNEMNDLLFTKCIKVVEETVKESKLTKDQIDNVVLVGGSSRIPEVQRRLTEFFDGKSLIMTLNPDEVVAQGAAYRAAMISGSKSRELAGIKFRDVNPLSLGIEVIGERFSTIIPKNTPLPVKRTETYCTTKDYQTSILVSIYEGEDLKVKNNNLLGEFTLLNIPSKRRGEEPVDVTIECDDEGLIHVTAKVISNDSSEEIKIQTNRGGLTEEDIQKVMSKNQMKSD